MKEKDYRQKTQALADERRKIAAYEQHIRNLESDPAYVAHVKAYQQRPAEAPKPPDDPIEALKWEMKQEVMKELAPQFQVLQAKQNIETVKAQVMRDPLFDETQAAIVNMVTNLPLAVREITYQKLDSDPSAYMETYADARKWVEANKAQQPTPEQAKIRAENLKRGIPRDEPPTEAPVSRKERAPILESAGRTVPTASEESSKVKRASEISKLLKQGQGIDDDTLFEYFDLKGITAKLS
jgi:hypothetical protein